MGPRALGLLRRLPRRHYATISSAPAKHDFAHCVIGGGVVGLAIARQLQKKHPKGGTILLERHMAVGTETSSRNSEVIHAGLYYPPGSLKTRLCIEGGQKLYDLCKKAHIPHRRTGKWIVAQTPGQFARLEAVYDHATANDVPMRFLSAIECAEREPAVRAAAGVLESPRTGIVDSHALMQYLLSAFEERGGDVALGAQVTSLAQAGATGGYEVTTADGTTITADVVVNAAGHGAVAVQNLLLPAERHRTAYFCKGTYFSYAATRPYVRTLIYPAPEPGAGGLGTHLTLDLAGRLRFGPDIEWIDSADDLAPSAARMDAAKAAIREYLPALNPDALAVDYCGIRPKIQPAASGGVGQVDFIIRQEDGFAGFVNCLGIESPGLTSSLAIAAEVERILYK